VRGERAVGHQVTQDHPVATERIAATGYDYVGVDAQHGLFGCSAVLSGLTVVGAGQGVGHGPPRRRIRGCPLLEFRAHA
jgi:2-keto-3-deoxy-L-rhamnonate aldolase RhmA